MITPSRPAKIVDVTGRTNCRLSLAAHALQKHHPITQRTAAWYAKPSPTFVDAIALARRHLWLASEGFSLSAASTDTQELPATLYHRMVDSLAYAA